MKELSVIECEAISGSGLFDFLRPETGTGNVSPPVTPTKPGGTLIIGGGIGIGIFPFIFIPIIAGVIKIPFGR